MMELAKLWDYSLDAPVTTLNMLPKGKLIVAGAYGKKVYLLNEIGELLWDYDVRDIIRSVGIALEPTTNVIVTLLNGDLECITEGGKLAWKYETGDPELVATTAPFGTYIGAVSANNMVYLFNSKGRLLWNYKTSAPNTAVAITKRGTAVAVGAMNAWLYYFNNSGKLLWKHQLDSAISNLIFCNDKLHHALSANLLATTKNGLLHLFTNKGQRLWQLPFGKTIRAVAVANEYDRIFVVCDDNRLYLVNYDGKIQFQAHLPITTYVNDLVASDDGDLIAIATAQNNVVAAYIDINVIPVLIKDSKSLIEELTNMGAPEILDAKIKLRQTELAFNSNNYTKAREYVKQIKYDLIDTRQQLLYAKVQELEGAVNRLIADAKDMNIDISELTGYITSAKRAAEEDKIYETAIKWYNTAKTQVRKKIDKHLSGIIASTVPNLRKKLTELKRMGVDVHDAENALTTAISFAKSKAYERAIEFMKTADDTATVAYENYKRTASLEQIQVMEREVAALKEMGADVKELDAILTDAHTAHDRGEFEQVKRYVQRANSIIVKLKSVHQKRTAIDSVLNATQKLATARSYGIVTDEIENNLTQAKHALEHDRYEAALRYSAQVEKLVQAGMDKFWQAKLRARITDLKAKISELKQQDVAVGASERYIATAEAQIMRKEFELADETINSAEASIQNAEKRYMMRKISAQIDWTRNLLDKVKAVGADIKRAEQYMTDAIRAFEADNFELAATKLSIAKREAYRAKRVKLSQRAHQMLVEVQTQLTAAQQLGLTQELREAEDLTHRAEQSFTAEKYMEAIKHARAALRAIDIGKTEFMRKKAMEAIADAEASITVSTNEGVERTIISKLETILEASRTSYNAQEFSEAIGQAQHCVELANNYRNELIRTRADAEVTDALQLVTQLKALPLQELRGEKATQWRIQLDNITQMVEDAKHAIGTKEYPTACSTVSKIKELGTKLMHEYNLQHASNMIEALQSKIIECQQLHGFELTKEVMAQFQSCKSAFNTGEFERTIELAGQILKIIDTQKHEYFKTKALELITDVEQKVKSAEDSGIDVADAKLNLIRASDAIEYQDYRTAYTNAERAEKLINDAYYKHRYQHITKLIRNAEHIYSELKSFPAWDKIIPTAKLTEFTTQLSDTKRMLDNKELDSANKLAEQVSQLATELQHVYISKQLGDRLTRIKAELTKLRAAGEDTAHAHTLAQAIADAIEKHEYKPAETHLAQLETYIAELKKERRPETIRARRTTIERLIRARAIATELEAQGIDVRELMTSIKDAETALEAERYTDAEKLAINIEAQATTMERELYARNASSVIQQVETIIATLKHERVNVNKAERILASAKDAFEHAKYEQALQDAKRAEEFAHETELRHLSRTAVKILTKAQAKLSEMKNKNLQDDEIERLYAEAEAKLEVASQSIDYRDAITLLARVDQLATNLLQELLKKTISDNILRANSELLEAKRLEVDVRAIRRAETLIQNAEQEFGRANFTRAKTQIEQALSLLAKMKTRVEKRNAQKAITDTTQLVAEIKSSCPDADFSKIDKLMTDATTAFDNDDFELALQKTHDAEKIVTELAVQYIKREANTKLDKLDRAINELKSVYVDMSEKLQPVMRLYQEARSLIDTKDYRQCQAAITRLNDAEDLLATLRKDSMSQKAQYLLAQVQTQLDELAEQDLDVTEPTKLLIQAQAAVRYEHYEAAIKHAEHAQKTITTVIETARARKLIEKLQALRKLHTELKKLKLAVTDAEKLIRHGELAINSRNYELADTTIERAEKLLKSIEMDYKKRALTAELTQLNRDFTELQKWGVDTANIESQITAAKDAINTGAYVKAREFIDLSRRLVKRSRRRYQRQQLMRAIVTVSAQVTEFKRFLHDKLRIERFDDKLNTELTRIETMIHNAEDTLNRELFDKAQAIVTDAEHAITELSTKYSKRRAASLLRSTKRLLAEVKKLAGADLPELTNAQSVLKRVEVAYADAEYELAISQLTEVTDTLNKLRHEVFIQRALKSIDTARRKIADAEAISPRVAVAHAKESLAQAERAFELRDYEGAETTVRTAIVKVEEAKENYLNLIASETISSAKSEISDAKLKNIDVSEAETLITDAITKFESKLYQEAKELATEAITQLNKALDKYRTQRASDMIAHARSIIDATKRKGIDCSNAEQLLNQAKQALEYKDSENAIKLSREAWRATKYAEAEHIKSQASEAILGAQASIVKLKDLGIDDTDVKQHLQKSRELFEREEYLKSREVANEVKAQVETLILRDQTEKALNNITELEKLASEVRELGADISKINTLIQQAKYAFEEKKLPTVRKYIIRGKKLALNLKRRYHAELAEDASTRAQALIDELKAYNVLADNVTQLLERAKTARDTDDYERWYTLATEAVAEAQKLRTDYLKKRAVELITAFQNELSKLDEMGVDTTEVQALFNRAREAFRAQRFDDVTININHAAEVAQALKLQYQNQAAIELILSVQSVLLDYSRLGIKTADAETELQAAKSAFNDKKYELAIERAREADKKLKLAKTEYMKERAPLTIVDERAKALVPGGAGARAIKIPIATMNVLWQHKTSNLVWTTAISPDGNYIVAGSWDQNIYLLDKLGNELWHYRTDAYVRNVAITTDAELIVASNWDKNVLLLDKSGKLLWTYKTADRLLSTAIAADGTYIAVGSWDKNIYLIDKRGNLIWKQVADDSVLAIALSADGKYITFGSNDRTIWLLDKAGKLQWKYIAEDIIKSVAITAHGEYIVAAAWGGMIYLINRKGELVWKYNTNTETWGVAISSTGNHIVLGAADGYIHFFNLHGKLIGKYKAGKVLDVALTTDSDFVVAGARNNYLYFYENIEAVKSIIADTEAYINTSRELGVAVTEAAELISRAKDALDAKDYPKAKGYARSAEQVVVTATRRFKMEQATAKISRAERTLKEIRNLGIDIKDTEELLTRAKSAFANDDFDLALKLVGHLDANAKLLTEKFGQVQSAIKLSWSKITDAKNIGAHAIDAEKMHNTALELLKKREYDAAIDYARRAGELATRNKTAYQDATKSIQVAEEVITNAERSGIKVDTANALIKQARTAIRDYKYDTALKFGQEATAEVEKLTGMHNNNLSALQQLSNRLAEIRREGVNLAQMDVIYQQAKSAFEHHDYDGSLKLISDCERKASELLKRYQMEQATGTIGVGKNAIESLRKLDPNNTALVQSERFLQRATTAFDYKDYVKAKSYAVQARDTAITAEREVRYNLASAAIKDANAKLAEARATGIANVEPATNLIKLAKDAIAQEDFTRASRYAKNAYKSAVDAILDAERQLVNDELLNAQMTITELKNTYPRIDLGKATEILSKIQELIDNNKLDDAKKTIRSAIDVAEDVKRRYLRSVTAEAIMTIQSVLAELQSTPEAIELIQSKGIKLGDITDLYRRAKSAYRDDDLAVAWDYAKQCRSDITKAHQVYIRARAEGALANAQYIINKARELKLKLTPELERMVTRATDLFESRKYSEALQVASELCTKGETACDQHQTAVANNSIKSADKLVQDTKKFGAAVPEAEELLTHARNALSRKDYPTAIKYAEKATSLAKKIKSQYTEALNNISKARSAITELTAAKLKLSDAEKALQTSEGLLRAGDYRAASDYAVRAYDAARKGMDEHKARKLTAELNGLSVRVDKLRTTGARVTDAERLITDAIKAVEAKDYGVATKLIKRAEAAVEDAHEKYVTQRASYALFSMNKLIDDIVAMGIHDVADVKRLHQDALEAFDKKRYQKVEELGKLLTKTVERLKAEHLRTEAVELVETAKKRLQQLKSKQITVRKGNELLADATRALEDGDYTKAKGLASNLLELADAAKIQYQKERATNALGATRKGLEELKLLGEKLTSPEAIHLYARAEERMIRAKEAVDRANYEIALKYIEESDKFITDAKAHYELQQATDGIAKATMTLAELKKLGISTELVETLLKSAEDAFKRKRYADAIAFVDRADTAAERLKRQHKSSQIKAMVKSVEDMITNMQTAGIDVSKATALLQQTASALESEEYTTAEEYIKEAEQIAKASSREYYMTEISTELSGVQRLITQLEREDVDVATPQSLIAQAKLAIKYDDYDRCKSLIARAKELATKLRTSWLEVKAKDALQHARAYLDEVKGPNVDVTEAEKFIRNAERALSTKDFDRALEFAQRAEETTREIERNYLKEIVGNELTGIQQLLSEIKRAGIDISEPSDIVSKAESAYDDGDYKEARGLISSARELAEDARYEYVREHAWDTILTARNYLADLKNLGIDVAEPERLIAQAESTYESKYYKKSEADYKRAETQANSAIERLRALEENYKRQEVVDEISYLRYILADIKKIGVDIGEAERLLEVATEHMNRGDFVNARKFTAKAEKLARDAKESYLYDQGLVSIRTMEEALEKLKGTGADISELDEYLVIAKSALESHDFDKAEEYLKRIDETASVTRERTERQRALIAITSTEMLIADAEEMGADVTKPLEALAKARKAVEEGRYEDARKYAREANQLAKEVRQLTYKVEWLSQQYLRQKTLDAILDAETKMNALKALDIDVRRIEKLLQNAKFLVDDAEYERAEKLIKKAEQSLRSEERNYLSKRALDAIAYTQSLITDVRKFGAEISPELEQLLTLAGEAYENKDYNKAEEYAKEAEQGAKELADRYLTQQILDYIYELQDKIADVKNKGGDVRDATARLDASKQALEKKDFALAKKLAEETEKLVVEAADNRARELATDALLAGQLIITDFKNIGIRITEVERTLAKAKEAFEDDNYELARQLALQAERRAQEVRLTYKSTIEHFETCHKLINECKASGLDTLDANILVQQAATAFEEGAHDKADEYVTRAIELMKDMRDARLREQVSDKILSAQTAIAEATKLGADVTVAHDILVQAKSALAYRDYDKAEEFAFRAEAEAKEARVRHYRTTAKATIGELETAISDGMKRGADMGHAQKLLKEARTALRYRNYEVAEEFTRKAREAINEAFYRYRSKIALTAISSATNAITDAKNIGADVSDAERLQKEAENAFEREDYERVNTLAAEAEKLALTAKTQYQRRLATGAISSIRETIVTLRNIGAPVGEFDELLARAQHAFDTGRFEEPIELAKRVEELSKETMRTIVKERVPVEALHTRALNRLTAVQELINKAAEAGIEVTDFNATLGLAREAFEAGAYGKVEDILSELETTVNDALLEQQRKTALDAITRAKRLVREYIRAGFDMSEAEITLTQAEVEYNNRNYVDAGMYASEAEKLVRGAVSVREAEYETRVREDLTKLEQLVADKKRRKEPVAELELLLRLSRTEMESKNYEKALEYLSKALSK